MMKKMIMSEGTGREWGGVGVKRRTGRRVRKWEQNLPLKVTTWRNHYNCIMRYTDSGSCGRRLPACCNEVENDLRAMEKDGH